MQLLNADDTASYEEHKNVFSLSPAFNTELSNTNT